jgi:hypothetical protein
VVDFFIAAATNLRHWLSNTGWSLEAAGHTVSTFSTMQRTAFANDVASDDTRSVGQ